jgi:uncharacterized protein (DUF2267 family)
MATRTVHSIQRTVQKTEDWIQQLAAELGTEDHETAWRILRAYLQVLRERLTVEEAAQLAAQFTHLVRGVYYEGFQPSDQPVRIHDRDGFLQLLADRAQLADRGEAERAAVAATEILRRHVTEGELEDVMTQLPRPIREVLQPA